MPEGRNLRDTLIRLCDLARNMSVDFDSAFGAVREIVDATDEEMQRVNAATGRSAEGCNCRHHHWDGRGPEGSHRHWHPREPHVHRHSEDMSDEIEEVHADRSSLGWHRPNWDNIGCDECRRLRGMPLGRERGL
ncbi:MAG: hypothetical protein WC211_12435 [Dehalococcoidia bacterium]